MLIFKGPSKFWLDTSERQIKTKGKKNPKEPDNRVFMIKKFPWKMTVLHEVFSDNLILLAVQIYLHLLSYLTPTVCYCSSSLEEMKL